MSRHKRSRRPLVLGATASAAALAVGLLVVLPGGASAAPSGLADDFNGDGYRDLATVAPDAVVSGAAKAGAVAVNYGSSSGISGSRHKTVTQNSSGVPGAAEASDNFGAELASGDLNGDGYGDLVVGTPFEDVGGDADGGAVTVLWGSSSGLSGGTAISDPNASGHDLFGQSLAVGDFTGDGKTDLAVGSTGTDVWIFKGGFSKSSGAAGKLRFDAQIKSGTYPNGAHQLATGDFDDDGVSDLVVLSAQGNLVYRGSSGGPALLQTEVADGTAATVADFDRDGHDDLVVGNDTPDILDPSPAGSYVTVHYGAAQGIDTARDRQFHQDTEGVPGADESNDSFGDSVAAGDITGDGYPDLAVGVVFESIGSASHTGNVVVLRGGASGLTASGAQTISQDTPGVPGSNESSDCFGGAVHIADFNKDRRADLAIGAGGENTSDGAVWVLRGSSTGVSATGAVSFGPKSVGISLSGSPRFGTSLLGS
ncbi:FG-GAP-like repeat-containing protein [Streptomyces sp. AS02]|uniref:FG-GAP-like repeat-containing protein n=1 Tax=Streptomyces sp. AS02 TaxID=2938946 RepID=UPI0020205F6C|nr:FG-GAP-like repeat-containing protein [Streptomyces sp. AS02]MCL8013860.1 FG-GAP-like repeat-containing protein [Streptomyces sp. AS02]